MPSCGEENLRVVVLFPLEPARRRPDDGRAGGSVAEAAAELHIRVVKPG
jgi:hypothetical protein